MTTVSRLPKQSAIICGDALAQLRELPASSIDLILTSPPYNIGKSYEKGLFPTEEYYKDWMKLLITEIKRVLKETGSVCWQVGNQVQSGAIKPLDYLFYDLFTSLEFKLRNRIIWQFNFGLNANNRLSGRYETLLWFTKSEQYTFNLDSIRVRQLYPGKRHPKTKGLKGGELSGNPSGKNPSDFWEFDAKRFFEFEPVWKMPNVKANHPEKTIHPCQFPIELAERCVLAFTNPNSIVLDPFAGTGASVLAADGHQRIGIGYELDDQYVALAQRRLKGMRLGILPIRESAKGTPDPKRSGRVGRVPKEWEQAHGKEAEKT